jgi:glycosyltransferase involved in cell wall biosynthesis
MSKVDLLVCNYNTKDKLKRLLDTLHSDHEDDVWNLYVADNGSQDGSYEWLESVREDYDIKAIFKNPNVGYGAAINGMAALSGSDLVCALNGDTWFSTKDIIRSVQTFADYPEQAIMGPKQMDEQARIRHGGIVGENTNLTQRGWGEYDPNNILYKYREEVPTISGSIYFSRRSVWEEMAKCSVYANEILGKENYTQALLGNVHHFYEETWLSYHARHHGYKIFYDGTITMGHSWAASTGGPQPILREYFLESQKEFRRACQIHGIEHD